MSVEPMELHQAFTAHTDAFDVQDLNYIVDCFNAISLCSYETLEIRGNLLLCQRNHPLVSKAILLHDPVPLNAVRGVRKLIEISSSRINLLCDGRFIYGFLDIAEKETADCLLVVFEKRGCWKLQCNDKVLMIIKDSRATACKPDTTETSFKQALQQLFKTTDASSRQHVWELINAASTQTRGTNILITENAAIEAARLKNQSTLVEPFLLTTEIIKQVTRIDGTIIMDQRGTCYAIGAILDGRASQNGNKARGGRFNSAMMYYENSEHPCLITIISQDGDIDFIPSIS